MSRWKTFAILLILFFVIDFALTCWAFWAFSDATAAGRPFSARYGPSFALAATTLPLYPVLAGSRIRLLVVAALNSALISLILSILILTLRWRAILLIVIVVALLLGGMIVWASILERRVEAEFGRMPASKPAKEDPRFARLATALGIDDGALNDVRASVSSYLAGEIGRGDDRITRPPQNVRHFLVVHRWDLDDLERHLLQDAPPRLSSGRILKYAGMEKLLLVDALQSAAGGDHDEAWRRIEAAQKVTQALLEARAVWSAISTTESQLGVARKLAPPSRLPIGRFDPHREYVSAFAFDSGEALHEEVSWLIRPYVRLAAAERADSLLREARIIRRQSGCHFTSAARSDVSERVPFNPFGVFGGGARLAVLCNRMLLDFEGTENVLALKRGLPVGASGCPDRQWKVEGNVLKLEPALPATPPALPTHHDVSPPQQTPS